MQVDFLNLLLADDGLEDVLGSHSGSGKPMINWITRPDSEDALPALTLETISTVSQYEQDGRSGLEPTRVQVDIWGSTYSSCRQVFKALRALLDPEDVGFPARTFGDTHFHKIMLEADRDLPVSDLPGGARVFHIAVDFIIWHKGA